MLAKFERQAHPEGPVEQGPSFIDVPPELHPPSMFGAFSD
jgi:hypothetical protein